MNSTNIVYHGEVEINLQQKRYNKRNHGTINLFHLFARILTQETFNSYNLPGYLMVYNDTPTNIDALPTTAEHKDKQILNKYLSISSYSDHDDNDRYFAVFTSMLTVAHLIANNQGYDHLTLALISGDQVNILATIELDISIYDLISSGNQATIKWTMNFNNSDSSM